MKKILIPALTLLFAAQAFAIDCRNNPLTRGEWYCDPEPPKMTAAEREKNRAELIGRINSNTLCHTRLPISGSSKKYNTYVVRADETSFEIYTMDENMDQVGTTAGILVSGDGTQFSTYYGPKESLIDVKVPGSGNSPTLKYYFLWQGGPALSLKDALNGKCELARIKVLKTSHFFFSTPTYELEQ